MEPVWILTLSIFAPLVAGLATLALPRTWTTPRVFTALLGPAAAFILICTLLAQHGVQQTPVASHHEAHHDTHSEHAEPVELGTEALPWVPDLNLDFAYLPDGLGIFFALLVAGIGSLIVLYARGYFGNLTDQARADLSRFYPTLGFFTTAMLGVVLADSMLLTVVFWELTSISSFLLIGWNRYDKKAVKLAMQALVTTGLGGMFLLGGVLLFGATTGYWRWSELLVHASEIDATQPAIIGSFILLFIGAGTKSAQYPFHYWLPGAMAAPTPVSAFLHSATMVKAGVFLVGRVFPVLSDVAPWVPVLVTLGTITMFYGAWLAVTKDDLKQIFAYTTVSQLGLFMVMYGLGGVDYTSHGHTYAALDLDVSQIANHAFYKAPLFIIAGAIGHLVGTRNLSELNGLWRNTEHGSGFTNKALVFTILLAGYALAAGPGTISFQAKEIFLYAGYHAASANPLFWLVVLMTVLTAVCNVAIFVRLATTLLGLPGGLKAEPHHDEHHDDHEHHEHEHGLWAAMIWVPGLIIVSFQYLGGLITPLWNAVFMPLEIHTNYKAFQDFPAFWEVSLKTPPLYLSLIAIAGGLVLGLSKLWRTVVLDPHNKVYPAASSGIEWLGEKTLDVMQSGKLRTYLVCILSAFVIGVVGAAFVGLPAFKELTLAGQDVPSLFEFIPGLLLGVVVCIAALSLPFIQARIIRIIMLGAVGFAVVSLYLLYQAPDLALTQLMVEIISVILFVYVLRLLPDEKPVRMSGVAKKLPIAIAAGVVFGWMTLLAATTPDTALNPFNPEYRSLGDWFAAHSYEGTELTDGRGGGGNNIVNVILVDFRGFDTMGEICVLALAAMGVFAMIRGRGRRAEKL